MRLYKEQYYWAIGVALFGLLVTLVSPKTIEKEFIILLFIIWFGGIFIIGLYKNRNKEQAKPRDDLIIQLWENDEENRLKPYPKEVLDAYARKESRDKKK